MADETTQLVLGDAAADALGTPPKRRFFRRKKRATEPLTHCQNCAAPLTGQFCSRCGQQAIDYHQSFAALLVDAADSFFNWDTKFLKTVGVLLTRPWRLTNDFNAGRRVRYVHPLRLYLLASIAFFLVVKVVNVNTGGALQLNDDDRAKISATLAQLSAADSALTAEQRDKLASLRARWAATPPEGEQTPERRKLEKIARRVSALDEDGKLTRKELVKLDALLASIPPPPDVVGPPNPGGPETAPSESSGTAAPGVPAPSIPPAPPVKKSPGIHFGTSDDPNEPQPAFAKWLEQRVKSKVGEDGSKGQLFLETLRNNIPTMMLCCIPLFALVLKILYIRQRRFYMEHLIYALHIHSYAYIAAVIITLLALAASRISEPVQVLLAVALSFAAVAFVFTSIRRVYKQGWFFTTFKFLLGGTIYSFVLVFAVVITAFVTLLLP